MEVHDTALTHQHPLLVRGFQLTIFISLSPTFITRTHCPFTGIKHPSLAWPGSSTWGVWHLCCTDKNFKAGLKSWLKVPPFTSSGTQWNQSLPRRQLPPSQWHGGFYKTNKTKINLFVKWSDPQEVTVEIKKNQKSEKKNKLTLHWPSAWTCGSTELTLIWVCFGCWKNTTLVWSTGKYWYTGNI